MALGAVIFFILRFFFHVCIKFPFTLHSYASAVPVFYGKYIADKAWEPTGGIDGRMAGIAVELLCGRHRLTDGYVVLKVHLHLFERAPILTHTPEENLHLVLTRRLCAWPTARRGFWWERIRRTGGNEQSLQLMVLVHGYSFGQKSLGPLRLP